MNFKEEMEVRGQAVEAVIRKYLPKEEGFQRIVLEAMNYSVSAGGKRLRPLLMWETYRMFGGEGEAIEPFMAAIEMIHTSSLIHDDLPAMDGDEMRRNKPSTWVAYGEDMAILAGDGLMIFAFETAVKAAALGGAPDRILRALRILSNKTGIYGMIGGQTVDVELTGKPVPADKLDFIYRLKTGALLEASLMIGAVLAGASDEEVGRMERIAGQVGMAFQIRDDILDLIARPEELGKPVKSDEKNHKTTHVTLVGLDQAKRDVEEISGQAIRELEALPSCTEFLKNLIGMLITREK
ncbi:MAG: polyprenyl synthetase family protein [Lachnospiraceae bacterium]|nr:polyprenyl synthetase family protein [Lachnospiraceae bacterium]